MIMFHNIQKDVPQILPFCDTPFFDDYARFWLDRRRNCAIIQPYYNKRYANQYADMEE